MKPEPQEEMQSPHRVQFNPAFPELRSLEESALYLHTSTHFIQFVQLESIFIRKGDILPSKLLKIPMGQ